MYIVYLTNSRVSSYCRNTALLLNLYTSVTWFGYFLIPRYFRCKRSADKSEYNCVKSSFQIIIYRLNSFYPIIINVRQCECDISSGVSIFSNKKGPGIEGGDGRWSAKRGRGGVGLWGTYWTLSCLYSRIFIYINITIKQMLKLYISVLGVYILPPDWPCKIPEVYKAPIFVKGCILFGEKRCSGSDTKFCY